MPASLRFPILVGIGLGIGLLLGVALAHFLWWATLVILAFVVVSRVRKTRR